MEGRFNDAVLAKRGRQRTDPDRARHGNRESFGCRGWGCTTFPNTSQDPNKNQVLALHVGDVTVHPNSRYSFEISGGKRGAIAFWFADLSAAAAAREDMRRFLPHISTVVSKLSDLS